MTAIMIASLRPSNAASAAEVVITTGQQGLTYNAAYGVNLASALSEYGYSSTVTPSKGSLDNLDEMASGAAQIGFIQTDAFQFWCSRHSNEAQKVDITGELTDGCVFTAVKKSSEISDEGDLKAGMRIVVGEPTGGSCASWQYLQGPEKDYAKVETYAEGGVRSLGKATIGEYDALLWVSAPDGSSKFLEAVNQEGSGLMMIDMSDWHLGDRLSNGKPVYELKKAVTELGWLSDSKARVPCIKTLMVANTGAGDEVLETASTVLLRNLSRVLGTSGK